MHFINIQMLTDYIFQEKREGKELLKLKITGREYAYQLLVTY